MTAKWYTRFGLLFILPNVVFTMIALVTPPKVLIAAFNAAIAALAVGVCVAYFPVIRHMLTKDQAPLDKADLLALGIFCSWFGMVLRTVWSLTWRYYGMPDDWTDTHITSYFIFLGMCGALFHLAAPGAVGDRVPTKHWVKLGALTAGGVFIGLALGFWFQIL